MTTRLNEQCFNDDKTLENALIALFTLPSKALLNIKSSKTAIKRMLLKTLFSNFSLNGRKLEYKLVTAYSMMHNLDDCKEWLGYLDSNQGCRYQKPVPYRLAIPQQLKRSCAETYFDLKYLKEMVPQPGFELGT